MRAICVLGVAMLVACASSRPGQGDVDASVAADSSPVADAGPDGPPLHGFGEPCTANNQCDSNLCILVGTSGQCTKLCGDCPDTYGCLGVEGISIDGEVSFVCVPTSNQLCTTCATDSECTLIGMDKCVTYADGDLACARDCSSVACPTGYDCNTVTINGANFQQCIASSGACDCTAANPGAMQTCNITTPWNVCVGAQTCGGATGWSSCAPPSAVDDPDGAYEDSNCDGLDGDASRAIFVSVAGANSANCGLVYSDPCQTIGFGISRAVATSRPHVYVQSGTYNATLTMVDGISVFGGYDFNWKRDSYSVTGHTVTIMGGVTAVRFDAITQPTWLDDVVIRSANATGVGASSIGVLITNSQAVELRGVQVVPGAGTAGADGNNGGNGAGGGNGGTGFPGCEDSSGFCSSCATPPRGAGGTSSCGRAGGAGGLPGNGGNNGQAGQTGAIGTAGGPGAPCNSNRACDGTRGTDGGIGGAGSDGIGGAMFGSFAGTSYAPSGGSDGFVGAPGNGGGGGGGGGGGTTSCDSYGSSGGGGGGGGCGGGRGTAGSGGGGSFGVIAVDSVVVISSSLIDGGVGGAGGRGGSGGNFGNGGSGGAGGPYGGSSEQDDGGDGAFGGNGGHGGAGGDGGGGGGGPSIAVVCLGTSTTGASALGSTLTGGTGGAGGSSAAPGSVGQSAASSGCPF